MRAERERLLESNAHTKHWERWGPYLAERAWGNPREDYSADGDAWNYFPHEHARSRAYRWTEDGILRHLRQPPAPLLRLRLLERTRPHPEGAPVRPDRPGRQSRRRRQGVLLLPGFHAHSLLHEGAVQVPAARISVRTTGRSERRPRPHHARIRTDRHRHLRPGPLLRHLHRIRQSRRQRYPDSRHRYEPRPRSGPAAPASDALVSQHLVLGLWHAQAAN